MQSNAERLRTNIALTQKIIKLDLYSIPEKDMEIIREQLRLIMLESKNNDRLKNYNRCRCASCVDSYY